MDFNVSHLSLLPQQEEIETIHHEEVLIPLDAFCLWATTMISLIVLLVDTFTFHRDSQGLFKLLKPGYKCLQVLDC